jgi:TPR repeat protein
VNFRLSNRDFDEKLERQRTSFNLAVQTLRRPSSEPKIFDKAHQSMIDLANQGFPPAMNLVGHWEIAGDRMTKDPIGGLDLIRKAAGKNYGPALYEIAVREIEGRDIAADPPKGLDRMRRAAGLGSQAAQSYLGDLYDKGATVTRDADKAKRYFRLCAALGNSDCQFRLGTIILETPEHPERDTVQAMAWLQLAAENGNGAAGKVVSRESENLTSAQITLVNKLKSQLVRK